MSDVDPEGAGAAERHREDQVSRSGLHAKPQGRRRAPWARVRRRTRSRRRPTGQARPRPGTRRTGRGELPAGRSPIADPAEGVVVPDGIVRVETREPSVICRAVFQSAALRLVSPSLRATDGRGCRSGSRGGARDAAPQPEVEVVPSDHPAQVEVPPLARRARSRVGKKNARGSVGKPPDAEDRTVVEGLKRATRARAGDRCPDPRGAARSRRRRAAGRRRPRGRGRSRRGARPRREGRGSGGGTRPGVRASSRKLRTPSRARAGGDRGGQHRSTLAG